MVDPASVRGTSGRFELHDGLPIVLFKEVTHAIPETPLV